MLLLFNASFYFKHILDHLLPSIYYIVLFRFSLWKINIATLPELTDLIFRAGQRSDEAMWCVGAAGQHQLWSDLLVYLLPST